MYATTKLPPIDDNWGKLRMLSDVLLITKSVATTVSDDNDKDVTIGLKLMLSVPPSAVNDVKSMVVNAGLEYIWTAF